MLSFLNVIAECFVVHFGDRHTFISGSPGEALLTSVSSRTDSPSKPPLAHLTALGVAG
jgi:hypothetical protein